MYGWFLLILIFILLLSFTPKEGYYSNSEMSAAGNSITTLKKKIKDLDKDLNSVYESKLSTNEIIAKLTPMLEGDEVAKYSNGFRNDINDTINSLSDIQDNMDKINDLVTLIKRYEGIHFAKEKKNETITGSLTVLLKKLEALEDKLSKLNNK